MVLNPARENFEKNLDGKKQNGIVRMFKRNVVNPISAEAENLSGAFGEETRNSIIKRLRNRS